MFSAMTRVFAIVIEILPPSSSHKSNFMSHVTFHSLWLGKTGSPLGVVANHSQLRGSCPNPTFQQWFLLQNANSHLLHHGRNFLELLAPFIESFSYSMVCFPILCLPWMGHFTLNGPLKRLRMVQFDLLFTGSCFFWRVSHLLLTSHTGSLQLHPSHSSVEVSVVFFIFIFIYGE